MLTHTQSLRSLSLSFPVGPLKDIVVAAARSRLKKNITLRELTLEFSPGPMTVSPIWTGVREHPLLERLCVRVNVMNLTRLEALLLSETSKITEVDIHRAYGSPPIVGLTPVLQALARRPTLTKLGLQNFTLGSKKARLLKMALCNIPSLQNFILANNDLGSTELAELAPALYHNTSIKVLDMSNNELDGMESAEILRDILRSNKTITILNLSGNTFGQTTGAVDCIADGLGGNSTLLKIDLSSCALGDGGVSPLAQTLGSRNTTLQKLSLDDNYITFMGVGVLVETNEQNSYYITDLDLSCNQIRNEGAILLARSLEKKALPKLKRLSLYTCGIKDDGFTALVSALELNTSLLHLDLRDNYGVSERAFLALAESLPDIKVLQGVDFDWCESLRSAMPLLLTGVGKNASVFRIHVGNCVSSSVPPTTEETARYAGG